jgi:hypothetical protein
VSREQDDPAEGRDAMTRTVEEARLLADQRREDGWDALVVPAVDTAPVPSDAEEREWGFVHIVPDNYAERVAAACETGSFPRYDIYRRRIGDVLVTAISDLDDQIAELFLEEKPITREILKAGIRRQTNHIARIRGYFRLKQYEV